MSSNGTLRNLRRHFNSSVPELISGQGTEQVAVIPVNTRANQVCRS